jgi:NADH-ubiquinone oxidoreductase chain 3
MSSMTLFILFVSIIAILFLVLNLLFAPHNPYAEKFSSFECGFHSFLGQNRSQFNVKFFIFGLVFLLFDLEITLVFPFAVSQSNNDIYGLVIVLIFLVIVTIGFIYELGKGALKIDSKQNIGGLRDNTTNTSISFVEKKSSITNNSSNTLYSGGGIIKNVAPSTFSGVAKNVGGAKRLYSTLNKKFFRDIALAESDNNLSDNNPFTIVSRFLKNYPTIETAKNHITFELIQSIQSAINNIITVAEFEVLRNITPVRFDLSFKADIMAAPEFKQVVGDKLSPYSKRGRSSVKAGVYIFTNKSNGYCYVGSSTQLADRLLKNYLGANLKNRKIDLALKELNLEAFTLDVYILPDSMLEGAEIGKIRNLTLFLEQYYILYFNPEYNSLKVAGSTVGPSEETLLKMRLNNPRSIKVSFTDISTNVETVYDSIIAAGKALGKQPSQISEYIRKDLKKPFLNKYVIKKIDLPLDNLLEPKSPKTEIEVLDLTTNEKTNYPSIREVERVLNINRSTVQNYILKSKPYLDRYLFKKNTEEGVVDNKAAKQIARTRLEITDLQTNNVVIYYSMLEASLALGCSTGALPRYISKCTVNSKPFKGRYLVKKL